MFQSEKVLVFDVDGTLCPVKTADQDYAELVPDPRMVARLRAYREAGFHIIIHSARHMRTTQGNVGAIIARYSGLLIDWLTRHQIPFDELHLGKPWPGRRGFYVDDRTVRPAEFLRLSAEEIADLLRRDACRPDDQPPPAAPAGPPSPGGRR